MVDPATGEIREDLKRVGRHIEAIYRNLAEVGIVIRDHTGDAYDEGQPMKVIASKPTPGQDKKRVSETLLPPSSGTTGWFKTEKSKLPHHSSQIRQLNLKNFSK
jgi:hypothetical protein